MAGAHPPLARGPGDRAGEVGPAGAGRPPRRHALPALGEAAGGGLGDGRPVGAAPLREVDRPRVGLGAARARALGEVPDPGGDEGGMRLVHGHPHPLGAGHPHAHALVLGLERAQQVRGAHVARLPLGLHRELRRPAPPRRDPRRARSRPRRRRAAPRRPGPGRSPVSA